MRMNAACIICYTFEIVSTFVSCRCSSLEGSLDLFVQ